MQGDGAGPSRGGASIAHRGGCRGSLAAPSPAELPLGGVVGHLDHPALLLVGAGLGRVLKRVAVALPKHPDAVPGVVEHPHDVPGRPLGHAVHGLVPGAEADLRAVRKVGHLDLVLPEAPAPVLGLVAAAVAAPAGLLALRDRRQLPREALIQGHLRADDLR